MNSKPLKTTKTRKKTIPSRIGTIHEQIVYIVGKNLGIDASNIDLDKDIRQQVYLDSMQFAEIYVTIVAELGIELPTSLLAVTTLREMLDIIDKELDKDSKRAGELSD